MRARFRTPGRPVLFIFVLLVPPAPPPTPPQSPLFFFFFFFLNARPFSEGICRTVKYLFCPAMRQAVLDYFAIGSHAPRRVASRRFGILRPRARREENRHSDPGNVRRRVLIRFCQNTFAFGLTKSAENCKEM